MERDALIRPDHYLGHSAAQIYAEKVGFKAMNLVATPAGLEPATCRLEGGCSIQLSYGALPGPLALMRPLA